MKTFWTFIAGIAIGGALVWYLAENNSRRAPTRMAEVTTDQAVPAGDTIKDKLQSLNLRSEDIKNEMARTGRVIRQSAQEAGRTIADEATDARTTTAIKSKLVADPDLSALSVSVNTTHGVVTLSGMVSSEDNIGKAMLLALQTEGVQEVISTLQVKSM